MISDNALTNALVEVDTIGWLSDILSTNLDSFTAEASLYINASSKGLPRWSVISTVPDVPSIDNLSILFNSILVFKNVRFLINALHHKLGF